MSFIPDMKTKIQDKLSPKSDDSQTVAVPLTQSEDFCAELMEGTMDFSSIVEEQFIVAVNTGSRNKQQLLASTIRGPFEFYDMVEAVGCMWEREQHHAKVYVLTQDFEKTPVFLDEGTIDYIEANWEDMLATGILEAALMDDDGPVISAGLINVDPDEDN